MSITVEGSPPGVLPPSRTRSTPAVNFGEISSTDEGGGSPLWFALVAVIGLPISPNKASATGWLEHRIPIFPFFPVRKGERDGFASNRIVSPPGQKCSMRRMVMGETSSTSVPIQEGSPTRTRTGLSGTLPLISKTRFRALSDRASAPIP